MANLAQTVNVLQALILTKGDQLLLTPTYHVFDLFKAHQDAGQLALTFSSPDYSFNGDSIPAINSSASKDSTGKTHISLVNPDPHKTITVSITMNASNITGRVLTSGLFTDHDSFDQPKKISPQTITGFKQSGDQLVVNLPAKSVVMLELNSR